MTMYDDDADEPTWGSGRIRPPQEQRALHIVHKLMIKHQNDLPGALAEWQQQFTEQPEMVRAICDAFFHKEAREFYADVTRREL